ncbi:BREX-1 system adenine-specific DNA-methyltransferase PglX [Paraburkholderia sabiae]|uniref:site-specific DNA-methyltransferase (adenine-specific) n=1 Tax=Paraburkholderia sabiae TaxID=273251 RepID=A0ABU9QMK6_9BURK|nr:BREX-1 system adenine-specific DNA-methyltransferase PglX [Paraburkholderia sabiae]WJZ79973.1 BREX-1 system adenine-specific DNA-methyltransferase PglX [Paraburkholderia sabiae]CAD6561224.1 hypothetical protein LMG24235_07227 [Paraburkholderia sabiae]
MNKANLKVYAPQARLDFIGAVSARANLLGISTQGVAPAETRGDVAIIEGREWPVKVLAQRQKVVDSIERHGYAHSIEAIAYTWFNRFVALRFMELHDYLDHGWRVLSSRDGGQPEILRHAAELSLPGLSADRLRDMQLAGNQDNELYKLLIVAQCNELSRAMPFLFERIDDESELLLPDNLLRTDSVIAKLVAEVPEEEWEQIEAIGWLYQFYISDRKDAVIGRVVETNDIPAATQLFTPNWIVQYLVQNSVGRLWSLANPASSLKSQWPFYVDPSNQPAQELAPLTAMVASRVAEDGGSLNPESLRVFDPACGSGHILVEAYELLKQVYLERGFRLRDIPRLILEKNLYGLDIDERAAQLAGFALMMKARADDRRVFDEPPALNIFALKERGELSPSALAEPLKPYGISLEMIEGLLSTFADTKTYGSLIKIEEPLASELAAVAAGLQRAAGSGDLYAEAAAQDLLPFIGQALLLGMQFDAVLANPPYMGGKWMSRKLKAFVEARYPEGKGDLFASFDLRMLSMVREGGYLGAVQPFLWMFLSTYEDLRRALLDQASISTLVQLEYNAFEPACVPVCTFVCVKGQAEGCQGDFFDLSDFKGIENQEPRLREAIVDPSAAWRHRASNQQFHEIPGQPIAYWVSERFRQLFASGQTIEDVAFSKQGLATGENGRFIRLWHEVSIGKMGLSMDSRAEAKASGKKWFPHLKGGAFRRWYGNFETVVNWEDDGREVRAFGTENGGRARSRAQNVEFYFKPGITWSDLTSSFFGSRQVPQGFIINTVGPSLFAKSGHSLDGLLGYTNSRVFQRIVDVSLQGLHYNNGVIGSRPYVPPTHVEKVRALERELVAISRRDWDAYEGSWEFPCHPCASAEARSLDNLAAAWHAWAQAKSADVRTMLALEEANNQFFIEAYGLGEEISPTVSEEHITLVRPDRAKDAQRFVSYAIGCMMGRYSLDEPGLIYAHAGGEGFDATRYASFAADADGILPTTDLPWFDDDGAQRIREFVGALWGAERVDENIEWLAQSLGPKSDEDPDDTIRRYVADSFFRDHVQVYKKRPVYWMFSSGRQGAFQALVYMHRYNERTLARLRSVYVVPLSTKLVARIELLEKDAAAASSSSSRSKLQKQIDALRRKHAELLSFDEKLRHFADMRIQIDLDDGVKVNYAKFGELVADSKTITGGSDD